MRKQAIRRPMLNEPGQVDQRSPENWGAADALPGGRVRVSAMSAWETLLEKQPMLPGDRAPRNWFTIEMRQAGEEIGRVFTAVSGSLMSRSQMGERVDHSQSGDWAESLTIAYRDRYKPWSTAMAAHQHIAQEPVHALIIDLCVEDITVAEAERRNGVWRGKGLKLIEYGLGMYVHMAGWDRRR